MGALITQMGDLLLSLSPIWVIGHRHPKRSVPPKLVRHYFLIQHVTQSGKLVTITFNFTTKTNYMSSDYANYKDYELSTTPNNLLLNSPQI